MKTTATATAKGVHRADFIRKVVDGYLTKREKPDEETRQQEIFKRKGGQSRPEAVALLKDVPKA